MRFVELLLRNKTVSTKNFPCFYKVIMGYRLVVGGAFSGHDIHLATTQPQLGWARGWFWCSAFPARQVWLTSTEKHLFQSRRSYQAAGAATLAELAASL